jgi:tetratricopeptide (TPR) repeat protein
MDRNVVLSDYAVVTSGGLIAFVVPDRLLKVRSGMKMIDGRGKYLMPGLVDFHSHPNTPVELTSYLANGVTTVLGLDGERLEWRRRGYELDPSAPMARLLTATDSIDGPLGVSSMVSVDTPEDARRLLDREEHEGADVIKTYGRIQTGEFKAVAAWADQHRMLHFGHISTDVNATDVFKDGLDVVAHAEELPRIIGYSPTEAQLDLLAKMMSSDQVALIPNLLPYNSMVEQVRNLPHFLSNPGIRYISPAVYQSYLPQNNGYASRSAGFADAIEKRESFLRDLTRRLHQAGILMLAGTDSPIMCCPGASLIDELSLLEGAGLSRFEVLQAAGYNSNLLIRRKSARLGEGVFGVIAPGARADLLLINHNPLESLAALRSFDGVMKGGIWWTRAELERALQAALPEVRRGHEFVDQYEKLLKIGDSKSLFALIDNAPKQMPLLDIDSVASQADALADKGKTSFAVALLKHSQPLFLRSAGSHKVAALLLMRLGDYAGAKAEFLKVLELAPEDALAKSNLRLIDVLRLTEADPAPSN